MDDKDEKLQDEDIEKIRQKYMDVASKFLDRNAVDRAEIKEVIDLLMERVKEVNPQRVYVEKLVDALKVQADNSSSTAKILDSFVRFMAANRIGTQGAPTSTDQADMAELDSLLDEDLDASPEN